jgi:uncharacterized delta-60 repeat protein
MQTTVTTHKTARPAARPKLRASFKPGLEFLETRALLNAGSLDLTFGTGGEVLTDFGGTDTTAKVLVQGDGKIVAVGTTTTSSTSHFALARYNSDGSLDATFGTGGKITGPAGTASGATLDANGNIIVAGQDFTTEFIVARFTATGALDNTFGTSGVVATAVTNAHGASVAIQPTDGKIVLAGYDAGAPPSSFSTIDVIRYNVNGTLDTTFGSGGIANAGTGRVTNQVVIQTDGKIAVAGNDERGMTFSNTAFFVKRINPDGTVDAAVQPFVDVGIAFNVAIDLALQSDGKFLELATSNGAPMLVRLNSDGTPDTTFGINGQVATGFGNSLAVQSNGQIIVAGASGSTFEVARYNPDGSLESRFAGGGTATASFATTVTASNVAIQPADGNIVVAGGVSGDFALARFIGGPAASLTGTPNQRFVEQVYLDLLGRTAEASGLAFWSGQLDQGTASRNQIALGIEGSPEYHGLVVQQLYATLFHRAVDPAGQATWTNYLGSGASAEQLEATLMSSAEYLTDTGNTTTGFVQGAYRDLLHRSPDAGAQSWNQAIDNGRSKAAAAAAILASPESDQDVAGGFYHRFLNRAGDTAGMNGYVNMLQKGTSWESVEALIMASDEYFARAQA